jgi:prepilin-type processing-associated H-X9-DG protein
VRRPFLYALVAVIFLFLLACAGLAFPFVFVAEMALGWVFFLVRVVPEVQVGWAGVATALVCLVAFAVGLHAFLAWLIGQTGTTAEGAPRRWSRRWTGAIVAAVVLMFVAGMATAGAAHQVGWLLTSKESILRSSSFAARRAQSVNNLKQIGLGIKSYGDVHVDSLPAPIFDRQGRPLHGWMTKILPHVEQAELYNAVNLSLPWDDPRNAAPFQQVVNTYINPGVRSGEQRDPAGYAPGHYAENAYLVGVASMKDVKDGTSQTILAGEVPGGFRPWGDPVNWRDPGKGINRAPDGFGGPYPGGANVLFGDGSVRFLRNTIDPRVMKALGTPAGADSPSPDEF